MDQITREDLRTALAPFATRDEMRVEIRAALGEYPTREEMHVVLARFPTREEMREALREEGERTRRHFDVVAESLSSDIRLLAEGQVALHQRIEDVRTELRADIAALDRRVMRLESVRRRPG